MSKWNLWKGKEHNSMYRHPYSSVLGPVLFIMHTTRVKTIYWFTVNKAWNVLIFFSNYDHQILSLQNFVSRIKPWMSQNRQKLNDEKTETLRNLPPFAAFSSLTHSLVLGSTSTYFSDNLRDLHFVFEYDFSIKRCQSPYPELRRMSSIRSIHYLSGNKSIG